jgi:glutamate-1-semialdehyde 2,1-aminomutase
MNAIEERYRARTRKSAELERRAERVMPGGDTRTVAWHQPYPLTIARGEGPFIWDVDGNRYIDLLGNYTSLVHGHAYPPIVDAMVHASRSGTAWAARSQAQVELAEILCERIASVEQVRFCNSGSEAGMLAAQAARHITGRKVLLMARHGYHGSYFATAPAEAGAVAGRQERLPHYVHSASGSSRNDLLADFGNTASFEKILRERGDEIATVFLEPVLGSGGVVTPPPDFLERVAHAAHRAGALFVLDEVITLRLSPGGAQELFGIRPDLTMMGKIIGGGLPVGALGGSAEVMACFDPHKPGSLYHSGTFNGNPATCAAGAVSITELTSERIAIMDAQAQRLSAGLEREGNRLELRMSMRRAGSLMNVVFAPELADEAARLYRNFHLSSLNHGIFIAPRGLIALSTVITAELITEAGERFAAALRDTVEN